MYPWEDPKELHWFILTQREKRFLITDEHLILKEGEWLPNSPLTTMKQK